MNSLIFLSHHHRTPTSPIINLHRVIEVHDQIMPVSIGKIGSLLTFANLKRFCKIAKQDRYSARFDEGETGKCVKLPGEYGSTIDGSSSSDISSDSGHTTTKEKEAYIEEFLRTVYPLVCLKSGVRIPLVVFSENSSGEGLFEYSFASEADMVLYWKAVCDLNDLKPSEEGTKKTRERIIECCMERNTGAARAYISDDVRVRVVEVYKTYETLIGCMYSTAVYYTDQLDGDDDICSNGKDELAETSARQDSSSSIGISSICSIPNLSHMEKIDLSFQRPKQQVESERVLSVDEALAVERAAGKLGGDESSVNFASRRKNIAFVIRVSGTWLSLRQDYFNQAEDYNDRTGGYRRYYRELPAEFVQQPEVIKLLDAFADKFSVPDGQMSLVQVQTSVIGTDDEGKCLTGQGIHSDGADVAMIAVLRRENVAGACSAVFADPAGENTLFGPQPLQGGEVVYWQDNAVYHYVEPARRFDRKKKGYRTVLIAHYPATHYISGKKNLNNTLPPSGVHPPYLLKK